MDYDPSKKLFIFTVAERELAPDIIPAYVVPESEAPVMVQLLEGRYKATQAIVDTEFGYDPDMDYRQEKRPAHSLTAIRQYGLSKQIRERYPGEID